MDFESTRAVGHTFSDQRPERRPARLRVPETQRAARAGLRSAIGTPVNESGDPTGADLQVTALDCQVHLCGIAVDAHLTKAGIVEVQARLRCQGEQVGR